MGRERGVHSMHEISMLSWCILIFHDIIIIYMIKYKQEILQDLDKTQLIHSLLP